MIEGVEADDYNYSRALLSRVLREDKKHARSSVDIPTCYDDFLIVDHLDEISAPYSPRSFAVKIAEDNVAGWATHAAIRAALLRRVSEVQSRKRPAPPIPRGETSPIHSEQRAAFPIIDQDRLRRHPKFRKPRDLNRMLYSKASEDWVTWTVFRLLERSAPTSWWFDLIELARTANPQLILPPGWDEIPEVRPWDCVPSPRGYDAASRDRMRGSNNKSWVKRSHNPRPVEGESEIDVILRNSALVVFAEAKLGSDISLSTKYDPHRNQIVRNIDCVLDRAEGRIPMFWMLVRDASQERSYTQLISHYRAQPEVLVRELQHHDPETVTGLAGNLTLLLWKDIIARIAKVLMDDDEQITSIKNELLSRCLSPLSTL
jgi:hypothetical protein